MLFFGKARVIMAWISGIRFRPYPLAKGANDVNRKKTLLALAACIVLFAGAVLFALVFDGSIGSAAGNASPVVLSEILASNRTYPAPNGQFLDYIEVHNTTDSPIDISGYMLGDQPDTVGYTFPNGTVLPAHSYIVCWCDKESESGSYAKFGISKKGEDTIYLYNSSNVVIDTFSVPAVNDNVPLIRQTDGSWTAGTHASPGFENSEEGFAQWLQSTDTEHVDIVISEVMPGGGYTIVNGVGKYDKAEELLELKKDTTMFKQGKPAAFLQTLVAEVGIDAKASKNFSDSQNNLVNAINNQRLSVGGVDTEEEAMNLMRYQQAYNLSAQVISIMNQIYDKLINYMGV